MLQRSDVHVDRALTNYSLGVLDEMTLVADVAMPFVDVQKETDVFFVQDTAQARRIPETLRAMRTRSRQDNILLTTQTYAAEEYALHDVLPDRLEAQADEVLRLREKMAQNLLRKLLLAREIRVKDLLTTATNFVAAHRNTTTAGKWDVVGTKTKLDVDIAKNEILLAIGALPNLMIISYEVFTKLQSNIDIIDRIKYSQTALNKDLDEQLLAQYYGIERVVVSDAINETAKEGAASSPATIWPDDVVFLRIDQNPTRIDTDHFGVSFTIKRVQTKRWREEGIAGDVIENSMILVEKIVNSSAGVHLDDVVT